MIVLTLSGQYSWGLNHLWITIGYMNISSCVYSHFSVVVKVCDEIYHLRRN